jgi:hypothetical protein
MPEWLSSDLIFWGSITLMATVPVLAHYWYKTRKAEMESDLKRAMVERGMSADEICRVLRASSKHAPAEAEEA